jgi:bacterioferritin-associated ferredoxin
VEPDDHVCLCHRVSLRKLVNFMKRERPGVPSQLSECLGAGTGCQWCVPFLKKIHTQWTRGEEPNLAVSPESYAVRRDKYRGTERSDDSAEPGSGGV